MRREERLGLRCQTTPNGRFNYIPTEAFHIPALNSSMKKR